MSDNAEVRRQFEEWFSENGTWPHALIRKGDSYSLMQTHAAWLVWQAAFEAGRKFAAEVAA